MRSVLVYLMFRRVDSVRHFSQDGAAGQRDGQPQREDGKIDRQKDQDRKQLIFKHQDSGGDKSAAEKERWRQKRKQKRESWRDGENDSSFC